MKSIFIKVISIFAKVILWFSPFEKSEYVKAVEWFKTHPVEWFKIQFGFTEKVTPGQILNLTFLVIAAFLCIAPFINLFDVITLSNPSNFSIFGILFYEFIFFIIAVPTMCLLAWGRGLISDRPYKETAAPKSSEINDLFLNPLIVYFIFYILHKIIFISLGSSTYHEIGITSYYWILLATPLAWYAGYSKWTKINLDAKCTECNLYWTKQCTDTLDVGSKNWTGTRKEKEVGVFPNFHPPGRYVRDHMYNCTYKTTDYEDIMVCDFCKGKSIREYDRTDIVSKTLISTTPWVKADSEFETGRKIGKGLV